MATRKESPAKATKHLGAGARTKSGEPTNSPDKAAGITPLSVRLPKPMYDALLDIVHEGKKRGDKLSIHSVMLAGIAKEIAVRK